MLMTYPDMEEMIAESMTLLMERSNKLNSKDQSAIGQEFREWLTEGFCLDELLIFYFS
ncbi:Conserved hypothetical protein [Prochlorococcus marinus str. NATL2A]|uniref:Uncharacterized protein n=2 Tax=Prochlorococcus marinus TaxID=1219 RepID=A7MDJ6_PROMT|nr:Conserved hypothetical protein [Prochlorococcus marinus str. NATL2A]